METIGSVLKKIFKSIEKEELYFAGIIKSRWEFFVGEFLSKNSIPDRIDNKILFVRCSNPAWKQELFFFRNKIKDKINEYFKKDIISDVKVFLKK